MIADPGDSGPGRPDSGGPALEPRLSSLIDDLVARLSRLETFRALTRMESLPLDQPAARERLRHLETELSGTPDFRALRLLQAARRELRTAQAALPAAAPLPANGHAYAAASAAVAAMFRAPPRSTDASRPIIIPPVPASAMTGPAFDRVDAAEAAVLAALAKFHPTAAPVVEPASPPQAAAGLSSTPPPPAPARIVPKWQPPSQDSAAASRMFARAATSGSNSDATEVRFMTRPASPASVADPPTNLPAPESKPASPEAQADAAFEEASVEIRRPDGQDQLAPLAIDPDDALTEFHAPTVLGRFVKVLRRGKT